MSPEEVPVDAYRWVGGDEVGLFHIAESVSIENVNKDWWTKGPVVNIIDVVIKFPVPLKNVRGGK